MKKVRRPPPVLYDVVLKGWVLAESLISVRWVVDQCIDRRRAFKKARLLNEEIGPQHPEKTLAHLQAHVI